MERSKHGNRSETNTKFLFCDEISLNDREKMGINVSIYSKS